jgi:FkbM family methyltransferase
MTSEITIDSSMLARALAAAGKNEQLRSIIFDALREAEAAADDPKVFRDQIRWPLVLSLLSEVRNHRVVLENGLIFEVGPDSRIEQALLLSPVAHPDHVWEPQTSKLLTALATGVSHVIVGGAYIGDQVLLMARAAANCNPPGVIHAFEPMDHAFACLQRNLELNDLRNVVAHRLGLWDRSNVSLSVEGHLGLASSIPLEEGRIASGEVIESVKIDEYVESRRLSSVGLIMLDTEGGEEKALVGARALLARPWPDAPNVVFEVHRNFVDWTNGLENTSIVKLLTSQGYVVFAIRDFHDNIPMGEEPIEIIPVDCVYLEGPPHGFNLLATKDADLVRRLGLCVVKNVSPKLLLHKDPALHHPLCSSGDKKNKNNSGSKSGLL